MYIDIRSGLFPEHFQQCSSNLSGSFIAVFSSSVVSPVSSHSCFSFFCVVHSMLFHGSASRIKHLLRFLPHFDNDGLRNLIFLYVLYLLVVEYFRRGESSLDSLSMIWITTFLCKCHRTFFFRVF